MFLRKVAALSHLLSLHAPSPHDLPHLHSQGLAWTPDALDTVMTSSPEKAVQTVPAACSPKQLRAAAAGAGAMGSSSPKGREVPAVVVEGAVRAGGGEAVHEQGMALKQGEAPATVQPTPSHMGQMLPPKAHASMRNPQPLLESLASSKPAAGQLPVPQDSAHFAWPAGLMGLPAPLGALPVSGQVFYIGIASCMFHFEITVPMPNFSLRPSKTAPRQGFQDRVLYLLQ